MALPLLSKKATIELSSLKGAPISLRPALIVSLESGPPTRVQLLGGAVQLVKESPEEIREAIAKEGRRVLAGGAAYAKLKDAIRDGELESFISGDDGKELWIEALKEVSYGRPRSGFSRLLGIYGSLLSPFSLIKAFSNGAASGAPSPLDAEMMSKGYLRERAKRGSSRRADA